MEKFLVLVELIPLIQKFQRLEGKIEDISCKDLVDLRADLYFLILQKLKEKAIELEKLIDKKSRNTNECVGDSDSLHCLEKDLIKGRLSRVYLISSNSCAHVFAILILPPIQYSSQALENICLEEDRWANNTSTMLGLHKMFHRKLLKIISFESLVQGNTKHESCKEASGPVRSLQSSAGINKL